MGRDNKRKIILTKEQEKIAVEEIISFFENERNEETGNLQAMIMLSFFMEKIAPLVYNQAVLDAQKYMSEKVQDLYELMMESRFNIENINH